ADRQLIEIARALATARASGESLRLLVLDEPTSSLGASDADRLLSLVRELAEGGATVLYVTHALEEIGRLAQRFTVLRDGATVGAGEVSSTPTDAIVRMMAGRDLANAYPRSTRNPGEIVVSAHALAGARLPLDATFELRRGEVLGL